MRVLIDVFGGRGGVFPGCFPKNVIHESVSDGLANAKCTGGERQRFLVDYVQFKDNDGGRSSSCRR